MQKKNEELRYPIKFIWYKLTKIFLLMFLILLFYRGDNLLGIILALLFFIITPFFLYHFLIYINTSFAFDDNKIIKRYGVITKKSTIVHFDKIQNIRLRSGLLMRIFSLSSVGIWTSSQSQISANNRGGLVEPEIKLFLDSFEAEELRVFMIDKEKNNN